MDTEPCGVVKVAMQKVFGWETSNDLIHYFPISSSEWIKQSYRLLNETNRILQIIQQFCPSKLIGSIKKLGNIMSTRSYSGLQLNILSLQLIHPLIHFAIDLKNLIVIKLRYLINSLHFFEKLLEIFVLFGKILIQTILIFDLLDLF